MALTVAWGLQRAGGCLSTHTRTCCTGLAPASPDHRGPCIDPRFCSSSSSEVLF